VVIKKSARPEGAEDMASALHLMAKRLVTILPPLQGERVLDG
jgi:hypothetical protein